MSFRLAPDTVSSFVIGKAHNDVGRVLPSGIDYSPDGQLCAVALDDNSINFFSVDSAAPKRKLNCKARGVGLLKFTHHSQCMLLSSRNANKDESIQYLSIKDNRYLRLFPGHTDTVTSLNVCPVDDSFMTASLDRTIRFWDLRTPACTSLMNISGRPVAAYDPDGVIFAVASANNEIRLFDRRNNAGGPFNTFTINHPNRNLQFSGLTFSPDGKMLLLNTREMFLGLMDSFTGAITCTYTGFSNSQGVALDAGFSPDGSMVFAGSDDGSVLAWEQATGRQLHTFQGNTGPVQSIRWHPKKALLLTGAAQLTFWTSKLASAPAAPGGDVAASISSSLSALANVLGPSGSAMSSAPLGNTMNTSMNTAMSASASVMPPVGMSPNDLIASLSAIQAVLAGPVSAPPQPPVGYPYAAPGSYYAPPIPAPGAQPMYPPQYYGGYGR